ncbi:hypothetical protein EYF80_022098 [Liparis tanakae]|uniref:Uncharacterized protein n=1 Tax=Liparis tanakae TaxID=230148 RepID=A0A4Z2HRK6_9TELE|nr:hypothetical protein EYF80_022098 [Liparis tanakae]
MPVKGGGRLASYPSKSDHIGWRSQSSRSDVCTQLPVAKQLEQFNSWHVSRKYSADTGEQIQIASTGTAVDSLQEEN